MVDIKLDGGYRITSDRHQFILQFKEDGKKWRTIAYHSEIESLLHSIALQRVRAAPLKHLSELVSNYRKEKEALKRLISTQMGEP